MSLLFAHATEVVRPSWPGVLALWDLNPLLVVTLIGTGGLYQWGFSRVKAFPGIRRVHFMLGLVVLGLALCGPIAVYDDTLFWDHMVQHLLITAVAAPLLCLGTPVALALRALPPRGRRIAAGIVSSETVHRLTSPPLTWVYLSAGLWLIHFTPFYEAALESNAVHALEHLLFVVLGFLFWFPVVGLDPGAHRLRWPFRLVYLLLFAPVGTFLGLVIYSAGHLLYPAYAAVTYSWAPSALADQRLAGEIMWEGGMLLNFAALPFIIFGWLRHEAQQSEVVDRRLDRAAVAADGAQKPSS